MKSLVLILTSCFLIVSGKGEKTIEQFTQTQLNTYHKIKPDQSQYFTSPLEQFKLHNKKTHLTLKEKTSHSNKNSYNKTVYTRINIWQFDFTSEEKCEQAIDSLLTCFPNDCAKIQKQVDQNLKITPSIWIMADQNIYIAKIACEHADEKWIKFKRDFAATFADDKNHIILTECGKLIWTTKEKIVNT